MSRIRPQFTGRTCKHIFLMLNFYNFC
jgi:hypothetical protein